MVAPPGERQGQVAKHQRRMQDDTVRRRAPRSILSAVFLVAAVALFAVAATLWVQDRRAEDAIRPPDAAPGQNELIHVTSALEAAGIDVETLPGTGAVRSAMLETVGQAVSADGVPGYVFIYQPDAAAREEATLDVLAEDVDLEDTSGAPVDAAGLRLFTGSNVAVVLVGGDEALAADVEAAMASLP